MEDVSPEKQSDYVAAFLRPLCQKVKMEFESLSFFFHQLPSLPWLLILITVSAFIWWIISKLTCYLCLSNQLNEVLLDSKAQGLEESSGKVLTLQQIIMALNALSKVSLFLCWYVLSLINQEPVWHNPYFLLFLRKVIKMLFLFFF